MKNNNMNNIVGGLTKEESVKNWNKRPHTLGLPPVNNDGMFTFCIIDIFIYFCFLYILFIQ